MSGRKTRRTSPRIGVPGRCRRPEGQGPEAPPALQDKGLGEAPLLWLRSDGRGTQLALLPPGPPPSRTAVRGEGRRVVRAGGPASPARKAALPRAVRRAGVTPARESGGRDAPAGSTGPWRPPSVRSDSREAGAGQGGGITIRKALGEPKNVGGKAGRLVFSVWGCMTLAKSLTVSGCGKGAEMRAFGRT